MRTTQVGNTGVILPRIGLGCVTFGREIDEKQSFKILDYAIERGITFLDTAEGYGGGQARDFRERQLGFRDVREATGEMHSSEKVIGRWLASTGLRKELVIQTKVSSNFTPVHIAEALDRSLERLQTDYVDLYLLHKYDPETPLEVAVSAMDGAVRSRKTRAVGCSNFSASQLRSALEVSSKHNMARFEAIQPVYNLVHREIECDLLPLCTKERIATGVYGPLGAGFLTGKYRADVPFPKASRFDVVPAHADDYFTDRNFRIVDALHSISERSGLSMARIAMGWVFSNSAVSSVLIGASNVTHIDNAIESSRGLPEKWLNEIRDWDLAQ